MHKIKSQDVIYLNTKDVAKEAKFIVYVTVQLGKTGIN
jgi:hypothetical protein